MKRTFWKTIAEKRLLRFFPLILLGVILVAYGLFIPWLGFYLDDWYIVWFRHFFGSQAFSQFFAQDRPFLSWIYILITPILGDSPIAWQSFGVITRWLLGLAAWDLFKQIWPRQEKEAALGALFFSIFPGFQFHWFSVQYSQLYLVEAGMFFSLACSLRAARQPAKALWWILAGLLPGIYAVISVEYHFGLELLRPVLIWLALSTSDWKRWRRIGRTFLLWLSNLVPFTAFTIWRVFFFHSFQYKVTVLEDLAASPLATLGSLALSTLRELSEGFGLVWVDLFNPNSYNLSGRTLLLVIALVVSMFVILLGYIYLVERSSGSTPTNERIGEAVTAILLGLAAGLLVLIPFKAAGLPVRLIYPWNRFMIVLGFASTITAVGLLMLLPRPWLRSLVAALVLALSIGVQLNTANQFRVAWADQQKFIQQLTWRIPDLEPDTLLVTDSLRFSRYFSGPSLSAPINWIYAPDLTSRRVPFQVILTESPQIDESHTLRPDESVQLQYRSWYFEGNTNQAVFFIFNTKDCLQVVSDSTNNALTLNTYQEPGFIQAIPISDLSRINPNPDTPATPPSQLFGVEPSSSWCYYYEKADLARQIKDWPAVLEWYTRASDQGVTALNDTELYPRLEALAMTGQWSAARQMTEELQAKDAALSPGLCTIWQRSLQNNPPGVADRSAMVGLGSILNCPTLDEVLR